jgi:hypothetical protein
MFEDGCYEKYWNRAMVTDQYFLASRTETGLFDELK